MNEGFTKDQVSPTVIHHRAAHCTLCSSLTHGSMVGGQQYFAMGKLMFLAKLPVITTAVSCREHHVSSFWHIIMKVMVATPSTSVALRASPIQCLLPCPGTGSMKAELKGRSLGPGIAKGRLSSPRRRMATQRWGLVILWEETVALAIAALPSFSEYLDSARYFVCLSLAESVLVNPHPASM
ncbi:hypothetical protein FA95DRAFT_1560616 [Auriscalpium vulgare]|uniref:Uncharacterized protein n=1 Tax=Auriscalpium vulgare TaxID=40419 RepID=A0ACB8RPF7_9AGAM|nr:hypothetical protein FA95DRAFT_1560616 [Auriscalpium vulgare]